MFSPGRFPLPVFAIPERFPLLILLHDDMMMMKDE